MAKKIKLAILLSGGGTTAGAVIKACQSGSLEMEVVVIIANKGSAGGLERARRLGVETRVVRPKDFENREKFGEKILEILAEKKADMVSQNGWLVMTPENVVKKYKGRIINQHPGPLDAGKPDFGGKGMYGARVTAARIAYLWLTKTKYWWTEATAHLVNEEYDNGEVIRTTRLEFEGLEKWSDLKKKTEEVQARLLPLEHENVIEALRMMTRRKKVLVKNGGALEKAKKIAIKLFSG